MRGKDALDRSGRHAAVSQAALGLWLGVQR